MNKRALFIAAMGLSFLVAICVFAFLIMRKPQVGDSNMADMIENKSENEKNVMELARNYVENVMNIDPKEFEVKVRAEESQSEIYAVEFIHSRDRALKLDHVGGGRSFEVLVDIEKGQVTEVLHSQ